MGKWADAVRYYDSKNPYMLHDLHHDRETVGDGAYILACMINDPRNRGIESPAFDISRPGDWSHRLNPRRIAFTPSGREAKVSASINGETHDRWVYCCYSY